MDVTDILMMNYNLFKKMKTLAEKQEKIIFDDQMDEFNHLTSQRENIRKEITANSQRYNSETNNISHKSGKQKVKTVSMEISDIIRSIQETDKRIEESIIARKDVLLNDIKKIRKGQNAVRRYGGGSNKITRFLDRNG